MELNQDTVDMLSSMFRFSFFDPYILENHKDLYRLAYRINDTDTEEKPFQVDMTLQEMIRLEQEYLFSLKTEYRDKFTEDVYINNRIVRLDSENGGGMYSRDRFFNDYTINFSKGNNLNNLVTLSHEYIHCLSCKYPEIKENTSAYTKYTEMLSELGELKFLDFLTVTKNRFRPRALARKSLKDLETIYCRSRQKIV